MSEAHEQSLREATAAVAYYERVLIQDNDAITAGVRKVAKAQAEVVAAEATLDAATAQAAATDAALAAAKARVEDLLTPGETIYVSAETADGSGTVNG